MKIVDKEFDCADEKSVMDAISCMTIENRKLDDKIRGAPEETLLKIHLHITFMENNLKKLVFFSGIGEIELFDEFATQTKEIIDTVAGAAQCFRDNCLKVKERNSK